MPTVTLKIIFTGLIGLSLPQPGEELVAALVNAPHHHARLYVVEGSCGNADECSRGGWEIECLIPVLELDGMTLEVIDGQSSDGLHIIRERRPEAMVPRNPTEARAISWMPSMDKIILSPGLVRMEPVCRRYDASCDKASARFFLDEGEVTSCHFIHDERYLTTFAVARHGRQALADAVQVKYEIRGDLLLRSNDGRREFRIKPVGGKITVVAGAFPEPNSASAEEESELGHFRMFYPLTDHGLWPLVRPVPEKPLPFRMKRDFGECETDLRALDGKACPLFKSVHLPGKCDAATYP